jgi:hypothetical protein
MQLNFIHLQHKLGQGNVYSGFHHVENGEKVNEVQDSEFLNEPAGVSAYEIDPTRCKYTFLEDLE